jgi:phosphoglycerate kinase
MVKVVTELPDGAVSGRRVFVRVDLNVPLTPAGGVADDARIRACLPTIEHLKGRGARIVLGSHLGRPKGGPDPKLSLEPVAARLAELISADVRLADEVVGDGARKVVNDLRDGEVALLENLRFHPGEEANDEQLCRQLASYADTYVNDAFGTAHRAHASTVGMVKLIAEKAAGLLMMKELDFLGRLLGTVERPFLAIVGGAKVSDKIAVLENLCARVDAFVIGGAMANTFWKAKGGQLGKSRVEDDKLAVAKAFLRKAEEKGVAVLLPVDVVAASGLDATSGKNVPGNEVPADLSALDIGDKARLEFADRVKKARTIFWNGPMGVFEKAPFAGGTIAVAKAVAANRGLTVVGGGDSVAAVEQAGVANQITHISTGGGASLELLEGHTLPGVAALEVNA